MTRSSLVLLVANLFASSAFGAVTYVSQTRQLSVNAGGGNTDATSAPDFGPFNASIARNYIGGIVGNCTASQNSQLLSDRLLASGGASPSDGNSGFGGSARSLFDVTFSVDQPTSYHLHGNWTTDFVTSGQESFPTSMFVRVPGVFDSTFAAPPLNGGPAQATFDVSGTLAPGSYRLWIDFDWTFLNFSGNFGTEHSSYNVTLEIPAPASAALGLLGLGAASRRRRTR